MCANLGYLSVQFIRMELLATESWGVGTDLRMIAFQQLNLKCSGK